MCAVCVEHTQNKGRAVSWATWLQTEFRGQLVHPQPASFCGFQAYQSSKGMPRPPYQWSLGAAGGQTEPRTAKANGGSNRVPWAKKITFSKVVPRPLGMLKQVFLGRFEPVVARFCQQKTQHALKFGRFLGTKNGSKMGQKHMFPKEIVDHSRCSDKWF